MVGHGDAQGRGRNTLAMASSTDNGYSFGTPRKISGLVQPGCGIGLLVAHDTGTIYISHDNNGTLATAGPTAHDNSRNNLTISKSADGGFTWRNHLIDPRFTGLSMLARIPRVDSGYNDRIGILWEAGSKRFDGDGIWYTTLPLD